MKRFICVSVITFAMLLGQAHAKAKNKSPELKVSDPSVIGLVITGVEGNDIGINVRDIKTQASMRFAKYGVQTVFRLPEGGGYALVQISYQRNSCHISLSFTRRVLVETESGDYEVLASVWRQSKIQDVAYPNKVYTDLSSLIDKLCAALQESNPSMKQK